MRFQKEATNHIKPDGKKKYGKKDTKMNEIIKVALSIKNENME